MPSKPEPLLFKNGVYTRQFTMGPHHNKLHTLQVTFEELLDVYLQNPTQPNLSIFRYLIQKGPKGTTPSHSRPIFDHFIEQIKLLGL